MSTESQQSLPPLLKSKSNHEAEGLIGMSSSSSCSSSSSPLPSPVTAFKLNSIRSTADDPYKNDISELRGRLCLLQTRIQNKEKADAELRNKRDEEFAQEKLARDASFATTAEVEKEVLKLRSRTDLLEGRLNLMYRELESLIAWTGFRNDETNSYRNFQEKKSIKQEQGSPRKSLRALNGKAGVEVILEEENQNQIGQSAWEQETAEYNSESMDSMMDMDDVEDNSSEIRISKVESISRPASASDKSDRRCSARKQKLTNMVPDDAIDLKPMMPDAEVVEHGEYDDERGIPSVSSATFLKNPLTNKFPCIACSKEFSNKKDAVRHYRIHTGERPYSCSLCQTAFIRKDQLTRHMANKHKGHNRGTSHPLEGKELLPEDDDPSSVENDGEAEDSQAEPDLDSDYDPRSEGLIVKRGRGRPRKHAIVPDKKITLSRGPGRPRKPRENLLEQVDGASTDVWSVEKNPETNKFDCFTCSKPFGNKRDLVRHFRLHTGERPYRCEICDQTFARKDKLVDHERKAHRRGGEMQRIKRNQECERPKPEFRCDHCPEIFTVRRKALRHMAKHKPAKAKRIKCAICGLSYSRKERLNYHLRMIHGIGESGNTVDGQEKLSFDCLECKKKFTQKRYLNRHMLGCKGLRRFACPECEQTFTQNSTLIQHRAAVHRGLKRFLCSLCGKGFYNSSNYKKHMRIHYGDKPYKCQLCDRAFVGLSDLKSHEAIHRGIKSHQCPECGLKFFRRYTLLRHSRVHTGEKPYMCDICGASFTQSGTLKSHKNNHHGPQKEYRVPKAKGKSSARYRVRPQPHFPELTLEEPPPENNLEARNTMGSHHLVDLNLSSIPQHLPMPLFQVTQQAILLDQHPIHYDTVDFVSLFN